jgi:hypothetical protein
MTLRFVLEIETGRHEGHAWEVNRVAGPPINPADVTIGELDSLAATSMLLTRLLGRNVRIVQEG